MRDFIAQRARTFRKWLLREASTEIRAHQELEWISRHFKQPIPHTTMSLHKATLGWIVNDIRINQRQCIVELGAGSSTQLIAKCIELSFPADQRPAFYSFEENSDWISYVEEVLKQDGSDQCVQIIHAPRKSYGEKGTWYNEEVIEAHLKSAPDCLIVDGPSVFNSNQASDRFRALHFFQPRMAENYVVFVDDAHRPQEKAMVKAWILADDVKFATLNAYLNVLTKGSHYIANP